MQIVRDTLKNIISILNTSEGLKRFFSVSLYRNAIYLMVASLLNSLLGFVFWIVVARFYPPEEVGLGSAAISAVMLLATFANLGLGYGIIRFLPRSNSNAGNTINTALTASVLASLVACAVFLMGLGLWSPALVFIRQQAGHRIIFVTITVLVTLSVLLEFVFVASRRSGFTVPKNLVFSLLKVILAVPLAVSFGAFGILSAYGAAAGVGVIISIFWLLPRAVRGYRPMPAMDAAVLKQTARFSLGNYASDFLWWAPFYVLPLLVVNNLGAGSNAHFYIAFTMATVLFQIPTLTSTSLLAEGSHEEGALGQHVWRSLRLSFVILAPVVAVVLVSANSILLLFGSAYSAEAGALLRLLAVSALPLAVNTIYLGSKRVEMKLVTVVTMSGLTTVAVLGLSYLLIPRMGINGAGIALLVGHGTVAVWVIVQHLRGM
jgi:O-antigen/teichoic acid export membrane protein